MFEQKNEQENLTKHILILSYNFSAYQCFKTMFVLFSLWLSLSKTVNGSIFPPPRNLHGIPNFPHVAPHPQRRKGFHLISISLFFALFLASLTKSEKKTILSFSKNNQMGKSLRKCLWDLFNVFFSNASTIKHVANSGLSSICCRTQVSWSL